MIEALKHIRLQSCGTLRKIALGRVPFERDEARAIGKGAFHLRGDGNADDEGTFVQPKRQHIEDYRRQRRVLEQPLFRADP